MLALTDRTFTILTGLVVSIFFTAVSVVAVAYSSGTFDDVYEVTARFDTAGQGLIKQSDVKIRGINVGRVDGVDLDDAGRAVVTLRISGDEKIPADARAVVRPKTLFGEKFVDLETTPEGEARGPYLEDGDEIANTVGSFELEEVLVKAEALLRAVEPAEVGVILDTLAESGKGEGERIRRQIQNWQKVAAVFAEHDADTRQFLTDFETLSGALARVGDDVTVLAKNLNVVLPKLNAKADKLDNLLDDVGDVSRDLADVLERSKPTLEKLVTEGGKTLQVLYDNRGQVPKLVVSLRDFAQTLAQAGSYQGNSYSFSGGGKAGTIKIVAGVDTLVFLACSLSETSAACTAGRALAGLGDGGSPASTGDPAASSSGNPGLIRGGPPVTEGVGAVVDLLSQTLAGIPVAALVEGPAPTGASR
ncbi:MAG: MCE family protein [Actinobacteria bacterium]|nr:MCE family protein [Actinomycetota bacterium]